MKSTYLRPQCIPRCGIEGIDYWDFTGALVDHKQYIGRVVERQAMMPIQRFGVTTTVFVDATDAGEAALIIERDLAGRFDSDLVSVSAHMKAVDGASCPACGSERIEHHEETVARRHFRRVRDDGVLVFDAFTDSFDDDGLRPRLWCGDCSQEWGLPEGEVDFE